jgi:phosphatidate cytidylyltransferase
MDSVNAVSATSQNKKKSRSLRKRLLSVAVSMPPILIGIYWGVWPVVLLVAIAVVIGLLELYSGLTRRGDAPRAVVGVGCALLLCVAAALQGSLPLDTTGLALALALLLALGYELVQNDHSRALQAWAQTFAIACYIGWLLSHYILLRKLDTPLEGGWLAFLQLSSGAAWVYLVLAITWVQDTMAFVVGSRFGRHRLAPAISPHKSWEGAAGGIGASTLVAVCAVPLLGLPLSWQAAALLGALGGLAGLLGDLVESLLKRQIGIKDSGSLLPGHGGVLDRADSMLFSAPVLYYLILLLTAFTQSSTLPA